MLFGPPWKGVNVGNSTSVGLRASHGAPCGYSVVTAVLPVGHGYCWPRPEGPSRMPARQAGPSEDEPTAPPYTLFEAAPGLVRRGAHAGALPLNAGGRHHGCREPPAAGGDRNATMPQVGGSPCLSRQRHPGPCGYPSGRERTRNDLSNHRRLAEGLEGDADEAADQHDDRQVQEDPSRVQLHVEGRRRRLGRGRRRRRGGILGARCPQERAKQEEEKRQVGTEARAPRREQQRGPA